jgi:ABC-type multidrug transport system fused ATPase/permease subunit
VQKALSNLMIGRTTFVIAHRLGTVRKADKILVLEDGQIAESGKHSDLLARGGSYARLHELQFAEEDAFDRQGAADVRTGSKPNS